jgi:transposase
MRPQKNVICFELRAGCAWRLMPNEFAPRSAIYGRFVGFRRRESLFEILDRCLLMADRERDAAVDPRCWGAGKEIKACNRHAMVDTDGWASRIGMARSRCHGLRADLSPSSNSPSLTTPATRGTQPSSPSKLRKDRRPSQLPSLARAMDSRGLLVWIYLNRRLAKELRGHHRLRGGLPLGHFGQPPMPPQGRAS